MDGLRVHVRARSTTRSINPFARESSVRQDTEPSFSTSNKWRRFAAQGNRFLWLYHRFLIMCFQTCCFEREFIPPPLFPFHRPVNQRISIREDTKIWTRSRRSPKKLGRKIGRENREGTNGRGAMAVRRAKRRISRKTIVVTGPGEICSRPKRDKALLIGSEDECGVRLH